MCGFFHSIWAGHLILDHLPCLCVFTAKSIARIVMEKALLILFLVLFTGRLVCRYLLEWQNTRHLLSHGREIPSAFQGMLDEKALARMVDYSAANSRLSSREHVAEDMVELVIVFLFLPFLAGAISACKLHFILQALIFFGILAAAGGVVGLPFNLYSTFVLEKKFGFSTITWRLWLTDFFKSIIISAILMGILISVLMAFILYLPSSWWFTAWVFFTLFEILLLWLYPVVIAPLFNKYEPVQDESLAQRITALMAKAGLKTQGIYQVDAGRRSRHTNAYFTGIGKTKRIVLFDTLLKSHTPDEILSVLAHEIGHWKKKHILKQLIFMIIVSFAALYIVYALVTFPVLYSAFGVPPQAIYVGLFLISLYGSSIGFFITPVSSAVMRRYEREADQMAVELVGTAEHMAAALKRLAKDNLANLHPHPLYVWFYYSHPPLVERIAALESMPPKKDA